MRGAKGILIFDKSDRQRHFLSERLRAEGCRVFETPYALEALSVLIKEDIGVVLAERFIEGMQGPEFKSLVERISPGANTIMIAPFSEEDEALSFHVDEALKLIKDYTKAEGFLLRELMELKRFSYTLADRIIQIFEAGNRYFFNNDHLVAELSRKIALRMNLEESLVEAIQMASLLRDLGRVMIHHEILEDTKRLSQKELTPIKAHPVYTTQILRQVRFPWNLDSIISQHHEHYDGKGYPRGLVGRDICIGARIISVADAYYAMTADRPYRKAATNEKAIEEITRNAGSQFDPEVVEVFLSVMAEEQAEAQKKSILIFEREANIAALIKLCAASDGTEIIHATSSIDVIGHIRHRSPDLIIVDVEALEPEAFMKFFNTAQQVAASLNQKFLLITPQEDYPQHFKGSVEYISKPLNMDEIKLKVKSLLYEAPQPQFQYKGGMGLAGDIEDFSLTDIIQILSLGHKSAKVEIERDREKGTLYLLHGKIVHASTGNMIGPEAFLYLVRWDRGRFYIVHGQTTDDINVTVDTSHLFLEAISVVGEKRTKAPSIVL